MYVGSLQTTKLMAQGDPSDLPATSRSSHQGCSTKKDVRESFVKSTGELLCQSLFYNKVASVFHVNFANFLKTSF